MPAAELCSPTASGQWRSDNSAVPSLREVLDIVSPEPLRALVVEHPAAAVTEVAIYDAADRGRLAAGQLLLAVGADPASREAHELLREAGAAGAAGIVLKLDPDRAQAALAEAARQARVALLAVRPGFAWESLLSVLRSTVAGSETDAMSRRRSPVAMKSSMPSPARDDAGHHLACSG